MTKVLTDSRSIRIKGRSFLAVVLTPDLPLDDWLVRLDDLAARSAGFFLNRPVVLDVADLGISRTELSGFLDKLGERNVRIMGIEGAKPSMISPGMPPVLKGGRPAGDVEVEQTETSAGAPAETAGDDRSTVEQAVAPTVTVEARSPQASLVINQPVRSGQSIIFTEGDVTIVGSVASGAEVIAGGSVHIYGALRGRAMAGSVGNAAARIFCRKLEAELIAIDGIYKMAEDLPSELLGEPVQLWLEGDSIMAEKLN
ncbi:septum site-determining protein MinC [Rhizobium sp. SSA_523]|uniref:septum site-determining protein MinC n=1 Tax=Rhizobium sp. SSA_523 TaxID=2952477 RepID=UPI0020903CA0|nr:septum site-determining protein MinC [Rhizobium sp. SSA_523]MCO5733200.1 septum site-determining protein MinC [Rhizobium sp. SSA_523]WKC21809.1 septum site-determining protein MinC [Rhizobium sp. SSA_523]